MDDLKKYIGVKFVEAKPMNRGEYNDYRCWSLKEDQNPTDEGYLVVYPDGYESWCPKEQFEEANYRCDAMSFGHAIQAMKKGRRVAREGWNGKGMFLYHVAENKYPVERNTNSAVKGMFEGDMVPYGAYIAMKTAQGNVVPWLASQTDMLSDDWCIVE